MEKDMCSRDDGTNSVDNIFSKYPLIGSKVLSEKTVEKVKQNAKNYISQRIENPALVIPLAAKQQITLAIISLAKEWDPARNSGFWEYIILQLGFRSTDYVIEVIKDCVQSSLVESGRLFLVEKNRYRGFKSSILIHALSTKRSWMYLYDFLFDFYKDNLDWKFVNDDPLIGVMTKGLQQKFDSSIETAEDELQLTISNRVYYFHEGIKKMVVYRPEFSEELFRKLLKNIDRILNQSTYSGEKTYEILLGETWYRQKVEDIHRTVVRKQEDTTATKREVAIDYSRIKPQYQLVNDKKLVLSIPEIRMKRGEWEEAYIEIFNGTERLAITPLTYYGNELGRTLHGFDINVEDYVSDEDRSFRIRIKISCDNEDIYDSDRSLYRDYLIFSRNREITTIDSNAGGYFLVSPCGAKITAENVELTELHRGNLVVTNAYLEDEFLLSVGSNLVAYKKSTSTSEINVIYPSVLSSAKLRECDGDYEFVEPNSTIVIILTGENIIKRYSVRKNGRDMQILKSSYDEDKGNFILTYTVSESDNGGRMSLQIIDLSLGKKIVDVNYATVDSIKVDFKKGVYFAEEDYEEASVTCTIDGQSFTQKFTPEAEEVVFKTVIGEVMVPIPKVSLFTNNTEWIMGDNIWVGDIDQGMFIEVQAAAGIDSQLFIEGSEVAAIENNQFSFGNAIMAINKEEKVYREIVFKAITDTGVYPYTIGRVYFQEAFLEKPEVFYEAGIVRWNMGGGYIGEAANLSLILGLEDRTESFSLNPYTPEIIEFGDRPLGLYSYRVEKKNKNLFSKEKSILLDEGKCLLGDPNLLRFMDCRICISEIVDAANNNIIPIKRCYIDKIEFVEEADCSEGICPIYTGKLFTLTEDKKKRYFSSEEKISSKGNSVLAVNPVQIIYISDDCLCVSDSSGDSIYYFKKFNYALDRIENFVTEMEPTKANEKSYSSIDLVHYRKEYKKRV